MIQIDYDLDPKIKSLACKGIPQKILNNYDSKIEDLDPKYGYQESAICRLGPNLGVSTSVRYKVLGGLMIPSRRFFFDNHNSVPFVFSNPLKRKNNCHTRDYRHYLYDPVESSEDINSVYEPSKKRKRVK